MSPANMSNFVHDLVEMARATEALPEVQRQLDGALKANADLLDRIQSLELRLLDRAAEIEALHAKVREAEQARDQAETMFLEETDRTASFKSFVENLFGTAGNLLKAAAPAEPVAVPGEEQVQAGGGEPVQTQDLSASQVAQTEVPTTDSLGAAFTEGVSVPQDPTPAPTLTSDSSVPPTAGDTSASTAESTSTSEAQPDDVGYHNEPSEKYSSEWEAWATRMDKRYQYVWPSRSAA